MYRFFRASTCRVFIIIVIVVTIIVIIAIIIMFIRQIHGYCFFSLPFFFVARRSPDNLCTPIRNVVNCRMRAYGNFCDTRRIRTTHKSDKKRTSRNTSKLANKWIVFKDPK